jgi:hypothetical protein
MDYECLPFCVTDLVLIYESVTSSASVVRWLALHSWTLNFWTLSSPLNEWLNSRMNSPEVNWTLEPESESELLYNWQFTAKQFVLAPSPLRLTSSNFCFQMSTCGHSPYVTSSLTRGWFCRLQLPLILASAVILRSGSRETHDHTLLSQIRDLTNLEGQVPVFISPRNRVAQVYHQALGSLFVASYDSQNLHALLHGQLYMFFLTWFCFQQRLHPAFVRL